jgi:hypothetical protein
MQPSTSGSGLPAEDPLACHARQTRQRRELRAAYGTTRRATAIMRGIASR